MWKFGDADGKPAGPPGVFLPSATGGYSYINKDHSLLFGVGSLYEGDVEPALGLLTCFDLRKNVPLYQLATHEIGSCIAVDSDGNRVFVGTSSGNLHIFDHQSLLEKARKTGTTTIDREAPGDPVTPISATKVFDATVTAVVPSSDSATVFLGSYRGDVAALRTNSPKAADN